MSAAANEVRIRPVPLDVVLDEQRQELWEAEAIIDCVAGALETHFGRNWPASLRSATTFRIEALERLRWPVHS